jgi:hypothetical protein
MHRSHPHLLALAALLSLGAAACSMFSHKQPPRPPVILHTATMDLTPGINVALVQTPPGFTPIAGQPPLWLQGEKELALAGTVQGRTEVLGFGGGAYKNVRLVAADGGPGAPHGKIVALAASPGGLTLAVAEATPGRIEVVLRYVISNAGQNSVATFDGNFHAVSLTWVAQDTIAVGLAGEPGPSAADASGLYLVHVLGAVSVEQVKFACPPSTLSFSPDMRLAVGEGDERTPVSLFDSRAARCRQVLPAGPIRVLGWAPANNAFLYSTPGANGRGAGVFRYTIGSGTTDPIAVSSSAAAYTGSGIIMALGAREIDPQTAAAQPNKRVTARIASFLPTHAPPSAGANGAAIVPGEVLIDDLGIPTTPAMLLASTMAYSHGYAELAMQKYADEPGGPTRKIVTFSIVDRRAFVLASGAARGVAVIGWAPNANRLVVFDGDGATGALAVITPER